MKAFTAVIIVIVALLGGYLVFNKPQTEQSTAQTAPVIPPSPKTQEKVSIKASFKIITNGTERIFTDPKYHNLSENVFIQLPDPSTVHVTKEGIVWDDFFKTLPMKLTKDCLTTGTGQTFCNGSSGTLRFYLNDKENKDLLDKEIQDGDKVLIEFSI